MSENKIEHLISSNTVIDPETLRIKAEKAEYMQVYGAGRITYSILTFLARMGYLDKVVCVLVSDKHFNPDNILGIPVCRYDSKVGKINDLVIVSVFEKSHREVCENLLQYGYKNFCFVSNYLYASLRRSEKSLDVDILNNTQWVRDDIQRLRKEISRKITAIDERIMLEACARNNVRYFDEQLYPEQYSDGLRLWYKEKTGAELNLDNPLTFNEKIQWIKLYAITPLMVQLSDKYAVRAWVEKKIGANYLIPLLGVWESFEDIDFNILPRKFILKCTHGSKMNEIVRDKDSLRIPLISRKFDRWLDTNFAFIGGLQLQYKDILPRIIAEEYLENKCGDLYDYKFWCFDGKVEYIMFLSERENGLKMDFFDTDWNHQDFTYNYPNSKKVIPKPDNLDEMIKIAETLSEGFPHVRVDLYRLNDGSIKFGEMTFTSCNGICRWSNEEIDQKMGELIKIV